MTLKFTHDKIMEGRWQDTSGRGGDVGEGYLSCKQGQDTSATPDVQNYLALDEM